jgi:hypothetical protein
MSTTERPPALTAELVQAFVIAGHGDLAKVQSMLAEHPTLLNATWDWGGGDYETALGGAAHVGNAEIARYLIAQGARFDLFAAAMLGELAVVQAIITAFPSAKDSLGAHGIPLKRHAERGGEAAQAVLEYLETLG